MAVVRRNILSDADSRDKYIRGVNLLKQEVVSPGRPSTYDLFVTWHHQAMMTLTPPTQSTRNAAHMGPAFLPWHRYMLIALERQLQRVLGDQNFGLPYWEWAADGDLAPAQQRNAAIWGPQSMGGEGDPVTNGPFAFQGTDPNSWRVRVEGTASGQLRSVNRGLRRAFAGDRGLPSHTEVKAALALTAYDSPPWDQTSSGTFRNTLEGWRPNPPQLHNLVHVWIGGDMGRSTSPNDPVFYLHHANVDRIWAAWQRKHNHPPYLPAGNAPVFLRGHRLNDPLFSIFSHPSTPAQMLNVDDVYTYDTLDDLL